MNIFEPIIMGLDQLRVHKLRAMLSILGILISVGSVTGIVSMGDGLRITIMDQLQSMGATSSVNVSPPASSYREGRRLIQRDWEDFLTNKDLRLFEENLENITTIIPHLNLGQDVRYKEISTNAQIMASNQHFLQTMNFEIGKGRFIGENDIRFASKVVVINSESAKDLYGDDDPLGKELKISGTRFTVIGVLADFQIFDLTTAGVMIIPYTTAQKRFFGNERLQRVSIMANSPEDAETVAQQTRYLLRRTHRYGNEFRVETAKSSIDSFNNVMNILKIVAGGIAGISLIVGGIGIMNIMLVSVTERTREIGIRMALGAKRLSILGQFILESIVLCLFGGGLGILLGFLIGFGISSYISSITQMKFASIITPGLMMFAVIYSASIGLFFGVYPAWRASKLDPVEALRYE